MDKSAARLELPETPREFGFYLEGKVVPAGTRTLMERSSPGHDVPVTRVPMCTKEDLDAAVISARTAFEDRRWSGLPGADRAGVLLRTAELIRQNADEIAFWETLETGKPIAQARGEIGGCALIFEYAAGIARSLHGDSFNNLGDGLFGVVTREPVGVVGLITPWNFPALIYSERVPFILASGCTVVAKPSEFTSASALIIADLLTKAGLPDGVLNVIPGYGAEVGQAMAEHMDIDMLSFTGSTRTGRALVTAATSNFKKLGLELGGKNPQIVFADADLDEAADGVAFGIGFNTGQCCVSGARLLVERSVADIFAAKLADVFAKVRVGDPLDEATQVGAITTEAQNDVILSYLEAGQRGGATVVTGGNALDLGKGRYIEPTIFADVTSDMPIAREEIFGPVLTLQPFDTVDEAIRIANDTEYGLAASVWTKNIDTALLVSRRVRAGRFWVNTTLAGGPELPMGGFKQSGWGREGGVYGVEEYTQLKSIHIATAARDMWAR